MSINEDKIEELIGATEDPIQRATLLVLSKIDLALDANTAASQRIATSVEDIDSKLEKHIIDEERLLYTVRGGQYVGGVMLSIIIAMSWYVINKHFERNDTQDQSISTIKEDLASMRRQIDVNTKRLDVLEVERRKP